MKSLRKAFYFLIVLAFLFSNCGGGEISYDDNAAGSSDDVVVEEPAVEPTEEPMAEPTEEPEIAGGDPWQEIRDAVEGGERVFSDIDGDGDLFFQIADEYGFSYAFLADVGFEANLGGFVAYPNPNADGEPTIFALPSNQYYEEFPNNEFVAIVMDIENRWDSGNPVYGIRFEQIDDETGIVTWENEYGETFEYPSALLDLEDDPGETEVYFVEGSCLICIPVDSRRPCFFCWGK